MRMCAPELPRAALDPSYAAGAQNVCCVPVQEGTQEENQGKVEV